MPHLRQSFGEAPRIALCLGLSLVLHLVALAAAGLALVSWMLSLPSVDITWLDMENTLGAPGPEPSRPPPRNRPRPRPVRPSPARRPRARPARLEPAEQAVLTRTAPARDAGPDASPPQQPPEPPFTTDRVALTDLTAGDAALMLLLRMDRIRGTAYEASVRRMLEVFYDHKTLLWSSGLDPVSDFSALLIATPNPYRVTRTFLAARHNLPLWRVRRALTRAGSYRRHRLRWRRREGWLRGEIPSPPKLPHDTRVVLLRRDLVLLVDPALIPLLTASSGAAGGQPPDAGVPRPTLIQRLEQLEATGGSLDKGPALILQGINLPRLVRIPPEYPLPLSLKVTMEATDPSTPEAVLSFDSSKGAQALLQVLPGRMERLRGSFLLRLLGVVDLLDAMRLERRGNDVWVRVEMSGDRLRAVLEMFRSMIPQVRVPGMPERRPPDAGLPDAKGPDARVPDARAPDARVPDARELETQLPEVRAPDAGPPPEARPPPR